MPDPNNTQINIQKSQLKIEIVPLGKSPLGSGSQNMSGWIGKQENNLFQMINGNPQLETTISTSENNFAYSTLDTEIITLGEEDKGLLLIRMAFTLKATYSEKEILWSQLQDIIETIDINLTFYIKDNFKKKCKLHQIYISNQETEITHPLASVDFDLDTDNKWEKTDKTFTIKTDKLSSENLYTYIALGYPEKDFSGKFSISLPI